PPCLGSVSQELLGAIVDAPILDGSTGKVFAFEGKDATNRGTVYQFDTALGSKVTAPIGGNVSSTGTNVHAGTFDYNYLFGASGTGHLFVCGKTTSGTDIPAIHRIGFNANGTMKSVSDG